MYYTALFISREVLTKTNLKTGTVICYNILNENFLPRVNQLFFFLIFLKFLLHVCFSNLSPSLEEKKALNENYFFPSHKHMCRSLDSNKKVSIIILEFLLVPFFIWRRHFESIPLANFW